MVQKRAQAGDGEAAFKLALAFEQGRGVPSDLVEALAWYAIAQWEGYVRAASRVQALTRELPPMEVREASQRADRRARADGGQASG